MRRKKATYEAGDSENNEVDCTLFDNCASDAYMAYLQNIESPVVVSLNLARVGFFEDGKSDDPSWICPLCKKQPEPKMKLHYLVRDKTGSASVIFWDKLAVQLVKKTESELKCLVKEDEGDIADELDLPVGKNLLLKLKMNDFNKKHPISSISVVQYTICEDLLDQFSEASTESLTEGCSEVKATVESVDAESVTPLVTTLDQSTIFDLSQHVTPAPIKGKRRITNKRKGDKDDLTTTSHVFFAGPTEERVTKVSEDAPTEESEPSSPKAIGQHDILIVSPGVLGRLVTEKWRENCECLDVKHEDMTMSYDLPKKYVVLVGYD
ncbi:hypothetical protein K1719_002679 [Acacia pycnantha]|nr:hypothetical protein K1719_002679 [Acacia pycnantha]